jgi:hypothetical protein
VGLRLGGEVSGSRSDGEGRCGVVGARETSHRGSII